VAVVTMLLRAGVRQRWRSWLASAFLVALVGGLVLAGVATARATETAFPRYLSAHGYDAFFYSAGVRPGVAALPDVASATLVRSPASGPPTCDCTRSVNVNDFALNELSSQDLPQMVKLVSGRMPDQSDPDEVLASFTLQRDAGVQVGTVVHVRLASSTQRQAVLNDANLTPSGPALSLRVVGIAAAEIEFPAASKTPTYDVYTTEAFARKYNSEAVVFDEYFLRLHGGAESLPRFENQARGLGGLSLSDLHSFAAAVNVSIDPQAVGWWILSGLVALVGIGVVLQALARLATLESEDFPTLSALGTSRGQLVGFSMIRTFAVAVAGALGAVALAAALSPFTPVGEARLADPSPGFNVDPLIVVPGAVAVVVAVLVLGVWPAFRTTNAMAMSGDAWVARRSRTAEAVASAGAPASAVIGVRHALARGAGRNSVPVGSALLGAVLAVSVLCGVAVFGSSLTRLTTTPSLYGQQFDAWFTVNQTASSALNGRMLSSLERPGIRSITEGIGGDITINGHEIDALAVRTLRGQYLVTMTSGRIPVGNEVILGSTTLRLVGAHVGSLVHVGMAGSPGRTASRAYRVVGTAVFPPDFNSQGLGTGAGFTLDGFLGSQCPPGKARPACELQTVIDQGGSFVVQAAPGPQGRAALAQLARAYPSAINFPTPPTNLVNFGESVNFPLIFGLVVALFGVATLIHFLVVSVARRRREIGLLKALGFVRRQVALSVSWQATTIVLVGILIGVPVGLALGRIVWRLFAENLGVFPDSVVNGWLILLIALGALVVANLLSVGPAVIASRAPSATLLRAE
jgi:FtsX-like permease family